ncbi:MAG TPA: hypothetical protein VLJ11_17350 [Bryobacteraceae bacterium]|nr:hypothetical protein [Bryobacteraceae bacterium]
MFSPSLIKSIRIGINLFFLALLLNVGFARAAQAAGASTSPVGTWKMESETPDGEPIPWTLTISKREGNWEAIVVGAPDAKSMPASDLKVSGNKVHFRTMYQGDPYDIDLTLESGRFTGTWSGQSGTGKTTGRRSP